MKTILAALLAGSFLVSLPAFAGDKPADKTEKSDKGNKKDKAAKGDKKDEAAKPAAGGGW
jgi:hypothetical protein